MHIDSHQHFWKYNPTEYEWMTDSMSDLQCDFLPDDLKLLIDQTGINGTIAVQARQKLEETEWLLELSDSNDFIKGVVGWVDLMSPEIKDTLKALSQHPKLKGVRHLIHDEPDERYILEPDFLRGLGTLQAFDLTYDLLLYPNHLSYAVEAVKQFPEQKFVLDHIAKPLIKDGTLAPWDEDIRELAKLENVYCKVSGMVTEASWKQWKTTDFKPYLDIVFDCFGPERLMFGSDWPVSTLSANYNQVHSIVWDYIQQYPAQVQEKILGMDAAKFYGVDH